MGGVLGATWEDGFGLLSRYLDEKGDCMVPFALKTKEGMVLGAWANRQSVAHFKRTLSGERVKRLEELVFVWGVLGATWDEKFDALSRYRVGNGNCLVPIRYKTKEGGMLGAWVKRQRATYSKDKRNRDSAKRFEGLKFVWGLLRP